MARYLAYTSPARGHLYPIVDTLMELRRRGHAVAMRTIAAEVERMRALGFDAAPIDPAIEAIEPDDWRARTPIGANKRIVTTFAQRAEHEIGDFRAAVAGVDPDAVLVDINCEGAATVAEADGLRWAHWIPYFTPLRSNDAPPFGLGLHPRGDRLGRLRDSFADRVVLGLPERQVARTLGPLRARCGLPPLARATDFWGAAPLQLYFTAEPFEYARSDWPDTYRLLGPGTWEPPSDPPEWLDGIDRPLVLVTLSTEFQDDGKLAAVALEALKDEDVYVVVTTAAVDPGRFDVPPNARVERFVPHGHLIARATCVVCHGGMGITQRALAAGVPLCVVPFGRDQLDVAGHVTWCDAGTRVSPLRLRPARLRAAVRAAVGKRAGARAVAEGFALAGGAAAAADAMEELAGARRSTAAAAPATTSTA
jgi:UDP:flavonoid glycosyltransferase YjiC (YdhE family)